MAHCLCGCEQRVRFRHRALNNSLWGIAKELHDWRRLTLTLAARDEEPPVDADFFRRGEILRARLIEVLHGERSEDDFDRQALREWLDRSLAAFTELDPELLAPPPEGERYIEWSGAERLVDSLRGRLTVALDERFQLDRLSEDDPAHVASACAIGAGSFLCAQLCSDPELMPLRKPRQRERARRGFLEGLTSKRLLEVSLFLGAALLRYTAWNLRRIEVETGRQNVNASWWWGSELLERELDETERNRLGQLEAPFRVINGEEWRVRDVPGYPTPQEPLLAIKVREAEPGTPEWSEILEGSRYGASGHFLIEAHKHALHMTLAPKRFEKLWMSGELFGPTLTTPFEWQLPVRDLWTEAAKFCRGFLAGVLPHSGAPGQSGETG